MLAPNIVNLPLFQLLSQEDFSAASRVDGQGTEYGQRIVAERGLHAVINTRFAHCPRDGLPDHSRPKYDERHLLDQ